MHTLIRIHAAAAYSIMLASAGALSVPVTAYAQGDAAAGENSSPTVSPVAIPFVIASM
jgi:hypothetical protein